VIFDCLKRSGVVHVAASEENPVEIDCEFNNDLSDTSTSPKGIHNEKHSQNKAEGFSVAFDPLDGSSIVDANFAVGTIMGIWPGNGLLNRKGKEQVLAAR
jgi:sedoheptulose-bisphosphatase